jgi:RND family efflux transporter MFP subunit
MSGLFRRVVARCGLVQGRLLAMGAIVLCMALLAGCSPKPAGAAGKAVEVTVTTPVISEALIDYQDYTGRLDAIKTVDVRCRVTGHVDKVFLEGANEIMERGPGSSRDKHLPGRIKEGDRVNKGDVLFIIDQRPFKATLAANKAQVLLQEANLKLAKITYQRARTASVAGGGYVAPLELDQDRAAEEQSDANLKLAQANVDLAQTNVDYSEVTAPISGRVSRRMVDEGNVVTANQTILTTIVSEDKLYCYFDVDERAYLDLLAEAKPSEKSLLADTHLPVMMRLANEEDYKRTGYIDFLDNRVNGNTGTIRMRGVFDNANGALKAGMFARIRLPITRKYKGLLVPDEAVQSDQGKKYVYVVQKKTTKKEDGTEMTKDVIVYRPVEVGQVLKVPHQPTPKGPTIQVSMRIIKPAVPGKEGKEGLAEGERVVTVGMQRVRPNLEVKAELKASPPAPQSPLAEMFEKQPDPKVAVSAKTKTPTN